MPDPIPVEAREVDHHHEPTVADLTPTLRQEGSLVKPSAPLADIEDAFRAYTAMCERLLNAEDYQQIGQKSFRKKSGWRKLATAFGVSVEMLWKEYEREGRNIVRAEVMCRAHAPNGRYMDGLGACDAFERCCPNPCPKESWKNHTCCSDTCNGFVHFSKPNHDIPATAMTRATNRACADLFGMGEVSAEEVTDHGGHGEAAPQQQAAPQVVPPKTEGWADADAEASAHKTVAAEIGKLKTTLPPDHPELVKIAAYVKEHGWPMPSARLMELMTMVAKAGGAAMSASAPQEQAPAPEPQSQAEAPAPAPESAPSAPSEESMGWDNMPKCPFCLKEVKAGEATVVRGGQDDEHPVERWHKECYEDEQEAAANA